MQRPYKDRPTGCHRDEIYVEILRRSLSDRLRMTRLSCRAKKGKFDRKSSGPSKHPGKQRGGTSKASGPKA